MRGDKYKCVILFCEGETDKVFYNKIIKYFASTFSLKSMVKEIKVLNLKGVGHFKTEALRKFKTYSRKNPSCSCYVILCYDNDVFIRFSKNPPFRWEETSKALKEAGAAAVDRIVCIESVEDWFLKDINGILAFLHLPATKTNKKPKGNTGASKLNFIFKKAGKIYIKGDNPYTEQFADALNIPLLIECYKKELEPLRKFYY